MLGEDPCNAPLPAPWLLDEGLAEAPAGRSQVKLRPSSHSARTSGQLDT